MKNDLAKQSTAHSWVDAIYRKAQLPEHKGNPLIEALPQFQLAKDMFPQFNNRPIFTETERCLPKADRMLAISRLGSFIQTLPCHMEVIDQLGQIVRAGYVHRRPDQQEYIKALNQFYRRSMAGDIHPIEMPGPSTAPSFSLFGVSGVGKTSVVERALSFLPRTIRHEQYGFIQVVHMKVDCPPDGRLKQLLLAIIEEFDDLLGTDYRGEAGRRSTVDDLILYVGNKAAEHHLGLLVIDEIQNLLTAAGENKNWMLNFFVTLANTVKVPVAVVGTPRAQHMLKGTLREARRVGDQGSVIWDRFSPNSKDWEFFLKSMWRYQWVRTAAELTPAMSTCMYDLSQGIHAVVVRLFQLAQAAAIRNGTEALTTGLLRQVAKSKFKLIEPMLDALRRNDQTQIALYEDLFAKGLGKLGKATQRDADLNQIKDLERVSARSLDAKMKTISALMVMGHEEEVTRRLVDELFAAMPDLSQQEAVRRILNAAETGHAAGAGLAGPSLKEIVARASAEGVSPVDAIAAAGLAESIKPST